MRVPSKYFFADTTIVYAPISGTDGDNAPLTTAGVAGPSLACAVDEVAQGQGTKYDAEPAPLGATQYELLYAADPGVSQADQRIDWTSNKGTTYSPAIILVTTGPSRPPRGLTRRWTVSASRRA